MIYSRANSAGRLLYCPNYNMTMLYRDRSVYTECGRCVDIQCDAIVIHLSLLSFFVIFFCLVLYIPLLLHRINGSETLYTCMCTFKHT